jgi:hypothetical protein
MKHISVLLFFFLPLSAFGESGGGKDALAKNLITELEDCWTLGIDSNNRMVDIAAYNKYKSLFDTSAIVDDDLAFRFVPGRSLGMYELHATPKDFDEYAHDAALQVSKFRIDSVSEPRKLIVSDSVIYEIDRIVYVEKPVKYVLQNADVLTTSILDNHPGIRFERRSRRADSSYRNEMVVRLRD